LAEQLLNQDISAPQYSVKKPSANVKSQSEKKRIGFVALKTQKSHQRKKNHGTPLEKHLSRTLDDKKQKPKKKQRRAVTSKKEVLLQLFRQRYELRAYKRTIKQALLRKARRARAFRRCTLRKLFT